MKYVVDTHVLIWFLEDNSRLSEKVKALLSNSDNEFVLPAIALAEAVWIVERGKTSIPSVEALLDAVDSDPRVTIHSLNRAVVQKTVGLSAINEMHDRQIVATALVIQEKAHKVALLTCDGNITAANLIPIIW